jgi:hypothetical protein
MENPNLYIEQLSGEITVYAIVIALEILIIGTWVVIYMRRQAKALQRTAEIEEQRNAFLIRSRREKLAGNIEIADGLAWLSDLLSFHLDYPLTLVDVSFSTETPAALVALAADGKSVAISPERPKDLAMALKRAAGGNGHSREASDLDAVASIVRRARGYRAALIDRHTSDIFDLEVRKVGELLQANWEAADELWFYIGASQAAVDLA